MKTLQLVSNKNLAIFGQSSMDIRFDVTGDPIFIDKEDSLDQAVAKAVLTEIQPDGYGSLLSGLRGQKERYIVSALIVYTVASSLQLVKKIQAAWRARNKNVSTRELLYSVDTVRVIPSLQRIRVLLSYRSTYNAEVARETQV